MLLELLSRFFFITLGLGGAGSFPIPLSEEETSAALERSAAGDPRARELLIEHNLRLVAHVVKKYYNRTGDQDDLISIGTIGLIKAVGSYKPGRAVRFSTYAAKCIENEILMYFRSARKTEGDISLSDPIDGDGEGGLSLMDVLSVEPHMDEEIDEKDDLERLRRVVDERLDERERRIILLRYGLGLPHPLTQHETSRRMGISRSYVSRIEKKALEKLRRGLEE